MWDERYNTPNYVYGVEPNHFVVSAKERIPKGGRVLCVADGEGRNGVYLARQGFDVVSVDISPNALAKAQKLAAEHGVSIQTQVVDLLAWNWPENRFEAVVAIFIQPFGTRDRMTVFDGIVRALRPGGVFLLEGYRTEQLHYGTGGPGVLDNLYSESRLRTELHALSIESMVSYDREMREGIGHNGLSALIDLVAVKP